jgi:hypothetical protein
MAQCATAFGSMKGQVIDENDLMLTSKTIMDSTQNNK